MVSDLVNTVQYYLFKPKVLPVNFERLSMVANISLFNIMVRIFLYI